MEKLAGPLGCRWIVKTIIYVQFVFPGWNMGNGGMIRYMEE